RRPDRSAPSPFTVVEKTLPQLQDALASGATTSEDIVREYLRRLSTFDRNGTALRSMLALNPHALGDARALDAERAAGRVRSPFHGIPRRVQGQHRRARAADDGRIAGAGRASPAPRLAHGGRHAPRRRDRAG